MMPKEDKIPSFIHNHPLTCVEEENLNASCSACGVALMSSAYYRCDRDCDFFLHKPCKDLSPSAVRVFGGFQYDLDLLTEKLPDDCECKRCGNLCKNFTYKCSGNTTFYLHCQCAFPLEINIEHVSHEHPLTAMCNESTLLCDACGRERKGIFFSCPKCSFYIHQDCCLLPSIVNAKQYDEHYLTLLYSLQSFSFSSEECLICHEEISLAFGAYICGWCDRAAHIHCIVSNIKEIEIVKASIHLPCAPDTFPSLIISTFSMGSEDEGIEDVKSKMEKYHTDHSSSWMLHHQENENQLAACNACIQPIISSTRSYYSCPESECSFVLHQPCANLPPEVGDYFLGIQADFFSKHSNFCSVFECLACYKKCNGFGYKRIFYYSFIDVECAASPYAIKHDSHSQHLLALSFQSYPSPKPFRCCDHHSWVAYSCRLCDHYIHAKCAFLPKTVTHKFDEHPLELIYNTAAQIPREVVAENDYLCEFCEQVIDAELWFYYCDKCNQSLHIDCIPSTGKLSKIKFGCKIDLPKEVHDHPVTLTRMLIMGSQRCGSCKETIEGFVDDMAFHCSICDFWIHFECARRCYYYSTGGQSFFMPI